MTWLEVLASGSSDVERFVERTGDREPLHYQVRWDVWRSLFSRFPRGTLRHLPSRTSINF